MLAAALPLVTANFLHAGFMHLAMNMLFFWIFGNALSEAVGRVVFLALYVLGGMVAVLVYVRTNPTSEIPMVGASGAIAGLEGAYFVFAYRWELPHAHVWPLDGPVAPWRLALVALVGFFLDTTAFLESGARHDTVAYGAHVGGLGFLAEPSLCDARGHRLAAQIPAPGLIPALEGMQQPQP